MKININNQSNSNNTLKSKDFTSDNQHNQKLQRFYYQETVNLKSNLIKKEQELSNSSDNSEYIMQHEPSSRKEPKIIKLKVSQFADERNKFKKYMQNKL